MTENRESCDMVRVADREAVHAGPPGSFCYATTGEGENMTRLLWHKLPDGCVGFVTIRPTAKGKPTHPSWELTGPEDAPTLSPSVHAVGRWHGYFKAGRMVSQ